MHLYGLSDLGITFEEFLKKNSGASAKVQVLASQLRHNQPSPDRETDVLSENIMSSSSDRVHI